MSRAYISAVQIGNCKVCNKEEDLRFGVCFDCSDHVLSQQVGPTEYMLWDTLNPENWWLVYDATEKGDAQ